jgi:ABC-2 type transport system permease protein
MISLFLKEIRGFLYSFTGIMVIVTYLAINSAFLWILPGEFHLLDSGWANIDGLFILSPWVFMFLLPAITMRMFSEEKRNGTLELLFTKPLSEWQIVGAKFLAAFLLVLFALLPTLLYFYSIYQLGAPIGSIDIGGTWGSYIGLLLLGGSYAAIGLFASSLTDNPIIAFLLGAFLSFLIFFGLEELARIVPQGGLSQILSGLGINSHYISVSRGVLDSRDLIYFISLILLFLGGTRVQLQSRSW